MIDRLRAFIAPEPQSEEPEIREGERGAETLTRRKHPVTQLLENIYKEEQRLEALQVASFQFHDTKKYEGGFAAIQMLIGAIAVPGGTLFRKFEPHIGSIIAYQGAHMFMRGAMTFINRVWPEPRGSVEARITGQRKKRRGAAAKEPMSEASLQERIRELSDVTRERQQQFREFRRGYAATKKIIPEQSKGETRENYLQEYIAFLNKLIDGEQETREGEAGPRGKGLVELARNLKEYHLGIVGHHQEHADVIGTFFATGTLLGTQQYLSGSPLTSETIAALASGIVTLAGTALDRRGKKESALSHIESIDREVEELKRHRLETTLRLGRLKKKRERTLGEGGSVPSSAERKPTSEEEREIQEIMDAYRRAVQEIIHSAPAVSALGIGQTQPGSVGTGVLSGVALGGLERGALAGFLGVTLPQAEQETLVLPVGVVPIERPERAISPPPFNQIESSSLRREVDPQLIVDLMNIAGRGLTVPTTTSIGWADAPNVVYKVFVEDPDQDISEEALDEAIRYLDELDDRLTAHNSVRNFQHEHLARLIAQRGDMRTRLYSRERAKYRELILSERPSSLRAAILRRSRIADIPDDQSNDISQEQFEESIRQWMQRKSTRDHDRTSLRKFLEACQQTLDAIPSHMPTRDEKAHIVRRAGEVLNEFLPEVAMPDPEQVSAWNRRIDEMSALFNRVQSTPGYERRQRVPELLAGEPFVPSDVLREVKFAQGHLRDLRIHSVDTRGVLGSYVDRAAWIVQDRARIAELAAPLIQTPTPEVLQNFFMSRVRRGDQEHLEENIQLLRIPGPKGPIHFVYRGIQHVAAARVAGLPRIIARVYELSPQDSVGNKVITTKYRDRYEEWLELKEAGLIDGELASRQDLTNQYAWFTPKGSDREETLAPVIAKIRFQTVPWLIWFNIKPHDGAPMRSISEITELYRKLYAPPQESTETGPLDKLKTADGRKLESKYLTKFNDLHSLITRKGVRTA